MGKLLVLFMACLAIGLAFAYKDKDRSKFKEKKALFLDHKFSPKSSKFCSNTTIAQAYLTKILSLIHTLQGNTTYESILKTQSLNLIKYFQDPPNQDLLHHDCPSFIQGLNSAIKADKAIERTQKKLAKTIAKQMKQIAQDLTNGKGFDEIDN